MTHSACLLFIAIWSPLLVHNDHLCTYKYGVYGMCYALYIILQCFMYIQYVSLSLLWQRPQYLVAPHLPTYPSKKDRSYYNSYFSNVRNSPWHYIVLKWYLVSLVLEIFIGEIVGKYDGTRGLKIIRLDDLKDIHLHTLFQFGTAIVVAVWHAMRKSFF